MFKTKKETIEYMKKIGMEECSNGYYFPGTYYLNHGEYARPDFQPRRYKDGWDIHQTFYYYSGRTLFAPKDDRVSAHFYAEHDHKI